MLFNHFSTKLFLVTAVAITLVCPAFANHDQTGDSTELTDANIAAIVVGANKIDISAGHIALKRSANDKVKEFAQRMIVDHQSVLDSAHELVTKLGVKPVNNELVYTLSEQSAQHEEKLRTLNGDAFDKAYIDNEVNYHKAVIEVIETQLIPSAQNVELKALLKSVLPAFKAHLKHSQMIQKELS